MIFLMICGIMNITTVFIMLFYFVGWKKKASCNIFDDLWYNEYNYSVYYVILLCRLEEESLL